MKIELVPLAWVHQVWPKIESFLADGLSWGGDDYTLDQAKANISAGHWMLVVAVDDEEIKGASAINIFNMPNDRVAFVVAIGGRLISGPDTYAQFCGLLKGFGATKIQGAARESIARLWKRYGFKERYVIVEAKI